MSPPQPRKLPRQKRAQVTRDAVLEAAARVFIDEGVTAATTARIAKVAGVSPGTLYQYYPNKQAIVAALTEHYYRTVTGGFALALAGVAELPLREAVPRLIRALSEGFLVNVPLHRALQAEVPTLGLTPAALASRDEAARGLREMLEARRGELASGQLEMMSFVMVRAMEAVLDAALLERPDYLGDETFLAELTRLATAYLQRA